MSKGESDSSEVFDVERIRQLVELMKANDLSEVTLRHGDQRIRLRRGEDPAPMIFSGAAPPLHAAPMAAAPVPVAPAPAPAASAPAAEVDGPNIVTIKSNMVGTFYAKPNPTSDPYVKVGDSIKSDTIVGVIEAMKMFNEIPAEVSGKIVAILVKNEEPVDGNKPLFKVDTTG